MTATRKTIAPSKLASLYAQAGASPAVQVGNFLFVSGQIGDFGDDMSVNSDLEQQCVEAFESVGSILAEAGATFADIVELVSYHSSAEDVAVFMGVKGRYIVDEPFPAWTGLCGCTPANPGALVEIKCTAVLDR